MRRPGDPQILERSLLEYGTARQRLSCQDDGLAAFGPFLANLSQEFGRVMPIDFARAVHHSEADRFIRKAMETVGSSSFGLAIYSLH